MGEYEKITSWDTLKKLRSDINNKKAEQPDKTVIAVGMATCGVAAGAGGVMDALRAELKAAERDDVELVSTGCYGFCYAEPMVEVREPNAPAVRYGYVDADTAKKIIRQHIVKGELLTDIIIGQEVQKP